MAIVGMPPPKPFLRAVLECLLGVVLALAGASEMFPLSVSLFLYAMGAISIVIGLREATQNRRRLLQLPLYLLIMVLYGWILHLPITKQYDREFPNVDFKEPANISWPRKQLIRYDLSRFHDYLRSLGIDVPSSLPPIAIDNEVPRTTGSATDSDLPIYRSELIIGNIAIMDRRAITSEYWNYTSSFVLRKQPGNLSDVEGAIGVLQGFGYYFNSSFWNEKSAGGMMGAIFGDEILWKIREDLGRSFTDHLGAASLKILTDSPDEVSHTDLPTHWVRLLMIGDSVVETECNSWQKVAKILRAANVPKDKTNSQTFSRSFPPACLQAWKLD